jgi:hypothetical protein
MPNAQGTNESLIIGDESSFKVMPGTPPGDKIPVINPSFRPSRNEFKPQSLTGNPEPRGIALGKLGVDFDFGLDANPASLQTALNCVLASRRQYGVGPLFVNDFCLGALVSKFAQESHSDISKHFLSNGMYFGSIAMSIGAEGNMDAKVAGKAAKMPAAFGASQVTGTVTDRTGFDPFSYLLVRVKSGGTIIAYSQQVDLTIDRKLGSAISQDQTNEQAVIFWEIADVMGSMLALVPDSTLLDAALVGNDTSIEIWIPGLTGYAAMFELATIKFKPGQIQTNGTGLVQQRLDFTAQGKAGQSKYPGRNWSNYLTVAAFPALNTLTLVVSVDGGGNQTFTFVTGDNTPDLVVTKINATATGFLASVDRAAGDTGGVIRLESTTKGAASSIRVQSTSTAAALLGYDTNITHSGLDGKSILATVFSPLAL